RFPRPAGELRARRRGGGRKALALHMGEIDPAALEEIAFLDDAAHAAAALRAFPGIRRERLAVQRFERPDDPGLQFTEVLEDLHFLFRARWPMSLRYCMPAKRIWSTHS